jgi:hypothetical protein
VEPTPCTPGAAWEKGQIENQVKNLRKDLFVPRPRYQSCAFRRSRPGIPSEVGHPFQLKPARDSDDPGHLLGLALVSAFSSVHSTGSASSF